MFWEHEIALIIRMSNRLVVLCYLRTGGVMQGQIGMKCQVSKQVSKTNSSYAAHPELVKKMKPDLSTASWDQSLASWM